MCFENYHFILTTSRHKTHHWNTENSEVRVFRGAREGSTALIQRSTRPFTLWGPSGDSEQLTSPVLVLPPLTDAFLSLWFERWVLAASWSLGWIYKTMPMKLESNEQGCWSCRKARFVRRSAGLLCRCHPAAGSLLLCLHLALWYRLVGARPLSKHRRFQLCCLVLIYSWRRKAREQTPRVMLEYLVFFLSIFFSCDWMKFVKGWNCYGYLVELVQFGPSLSVSAALK